LRKAINRKPAKGVPATPQDQVKAILRGDAGY